MIDEILDFVGEVATLPNWRYWICVGLAIIISIAVHSLIPGSFWDWFISVPLVVASIYLAWVWKNK